ncbi:MAG: hypothetical protein QM504_10520 [Pseudomonadota bacterium]
MENTFTGLTSAEFIAIFAGIIALIALCVSLWQGFVSRKHNQLSVKPYISTQSNKISGQNISCEITNHGVGPAFITSVTITCNNQIYPLNNYTDFINIFNLLGIELTSHDHIMQSYSDTSALAQGAQKSLFSFPTAEHDIELSEKLISGLSKLYIKIEYKCIYGNKYICSNTL